MSAEYLLSFKVMIEMPRRGILVGFGSGTSLFSGECVLTGLAVCCFFFVVGGILGSGLRVCADFVSMRLE